jgi:hypothetical protein
MDDARELIQRRRRNVARSAHDEQSPLFQRFQSQPPRPGSARTVVR